MDFKPIVCRINDNMSYADMVTCFPSGGLVNNRFVIVCDAISVDYPKSFYFITDFSAN